MSSAEYDLQSLFDLFNAEYFDGTLDCKVKWGRQYNKIRRRSIRLGSYNVKTNTIRINPILASPSIPDFVLRYVMHHEMLHADCMKKNPNNHYHIGEFNRRERRFAQYSLAVNWLKKHKLNFFNQPVHTRGHHISKPPL